jgi:hypothetical protein
MIWTINRILDITGSAGTGTFVVGEVITKSGTDKKV